MPWPRFEKINDAQLTTNPQSAISNPKSEIRCPLCGKTFCPGEARPCAACALAARCGLVMCPNCSYEFPA